VCVGEGDGGDSGGGGGGGGGIFVGGGNLGWRACFIAEYLGT